MSTAPRDTLFSAPAMAFLVGATIGTIEATVALLRYPGLAPVAVLQVLVSFSAVGLLFAVGSIVPVLVAQALARARPERSAAWRLGTAIGLLIGGGAALVAAAMFRPTWLYRHLPGGDASRALSMILIAAAGLLLARLAAPWVTRRLEAEGRLARLARLTPRLALVEAGVVALTIVAVPLFGRSGNLAAPASPDKPNLILISVDTLRADHLHCYGYPRETSPYLDALAERGVRFEHAYTTWPSSAPGHASMLTGLYPPTHGVMGNGFRLSDAVPTIAEAARNAGLRTAGFINNPWLSYTLGFAQGFETYFDAERVEVAEEAWMNLLLENVSLNRVIRGLGPGERQPATGLAIQWIERHQGERFFLFLHLLDPHQPYVPDPEFRDLFLPESGGVDPGDTREFMGRSLKGPGLAGMGKNVGEVKPITPELERGIIARYDECIANADARLGRLFKLLDLLGLTENTVILVTADHGENMNDAEPRFHHEGLAESTIRVPMILAGPRAEAAAANAEAIVSLIDVFPTLASLGGLQLPPLIAGADLTRPLPDGPNRQVYAMERPGKQFTRLALRTGPWKLIYNQDEASADLVPLGRPLPDHPDSVASLTSRLVAQLNQRFEESRQSAYPSEDGTATLDAERLEQLKALGYLN